MWNSTELINGTQYERGEFIEFDRNEGTIEFNNDSEVAVDIILSGGETHAEPIVAEVPFLINSDLEIARAYNEFHEGKYGEISFNRKS